MKRTLATAIILTGLAPGLALAQQAACGERDKILAKLGTDFGEQPAAMGLASNGNIVEVLASDKGSWTILYTMPDGGACVVATGQWWENIEPKPETPAAHMPS
ncbi:MAG: hypothetical protein QF578_20245 [Alphaproteobacteria bacterium]|jgi:hypothetical protein|nr:hypothetical protein [Alphaproteobacteria bacterium]MDP6813104.1 hypothetical protein [Alphaproteobacteria bacterium]|tara:strand:- start:33 stop:341 length:309 start_codon:yes stop_codon:yes gene_type:complete